MCSFIKKEVAYTTMDILMGNILGIEREDIIPSFVEWKDELSCTAKFCFDKQKIFFVLLDLRSRRVQEILG